MPPLALPDLTPLPRPAGLAARTPVRRASAPAGVPAPPCEVLSRSAGEAVVRFWHRAPRARAVAVAPSGWWRPDPADACDLEPAEDGWWTAAFSVPGDWQASFSFVEHEEDGDPAWWEHGLHHGPRLVPGRTDMRRTSTPAAVRLRERDWLGGYGAGADDLDDLPVAAGEPRVRLWRADADAPLPLAIVLDGEAHAERLATARVLSAAVRAGVLPPLAVAFVDAGPDRADVLGVPGGQAPWLADELVPRLRSEGVHGPVSAERERTIVTGSSFGGLTALFAVARAPETIGAAVAQSPSLWRYPHGALDEPLRSANAHAPLRVRLHSGRYEGDGPERIRSLSALLAADGADVQARVVSGGHDWTWWVPEAIEEIGRLLR